MTKFTDPEAATDLFYGNPHNDQDNFISDVIKDFQAVLGDLYDITRIVTKQHSQVAPRPDSIRDILNDLEEIGHVLSNALQYAEDLADLLADAERDSNGPSDL